MTDIQERRHDERETDRLLEQASTIHASGLLDAEWYRAQYPDVEILGMDPAMHYLKFGGYLARDPSKTFCTAFYREMYGDRLASGENPLLHHLNAGGEATEAGADALWAASHLAERGQAARAIEIARRELSKDRAYSLEILRANLRHDDEAAWLGHVNGYVRHFGAAPLDLKPGGGTRFERLVCGTLPVVETGPLVSVIMPAWNAESTIGTAARSILDQTWRPLELIIVDDASTDGTWRAMRDVAAADGRVKILRNALNAGPYVSKNLALRHATGAYITGHDADDWAHPERIARHVETVRATGGRLRASLTYMIRMRSDGTFGHFTRASDFSPDGVTRASSISCLFEATLLRDTLGHWDCVRFGGDTEMIARVRKVLGSRFAELWQLGMICLDSESNLTNDPIHGVRSQSGTSPTRRAYRDSWHAWHKKMNPQDAWLGFPPARRPFDAPAVVTVPLETTRVNLGLVSGNPTPTRPAARPAPQEAPTSSLPVADLAAKLLGGFSTNARDDLDQIRRDTWRPAEDRALAAWHLARWEAAQKNWERCDALLGSIPSEGRGALNRMRLTLLRAEARLKTGQPDQTVGILEHAGKNRGNTNFQLSLSNALLAETRLSDATRPALEAKRLAVLNGVLRARGLAEISLADPAGGLRFDNLHAEAPAARGTDLPKISVLMAVHNAERFLETSIRSMLRQTWRNLEIVAIDDTSSDRSREVLERLSREDGRLRVFANPTNLGAYASRNHALRLAEGSFVTVHDSDDWSHPQMLETEARALLADSGLRGTFTAGARVSEEMEFFLRPERQNLEYISRYYPSLLMRRADVDALGGWDPVRASADDEFLQRARGAFGKKGAFQDVLPEVPLTFLLNHEASLTNRKGTHLRSLDFGIRKEYAQQAAFWRDGRPSDPDAARFALDRTDAKTPFPVPAKLMSRRATRDTAYDLILVSDLSLLGGTRRCNEGYIAAATDLGCRIGLFHWPRYDLTLRPDIDAGYRRMSYQPNVDILVPEDVVECDTVLIHHPPILRYPIDAVPQITTRQVAILVNQSPMHLRSAAPRYYFPDQARELTRKFFGHEPLWLPISQLTRRILQQTGGYGHIAETNWTPPLGRDLPEGDPPVREGVGTDRQIVLGRHSRDHATKWPETPSAISAAYCANTDIAVWLMGGVRTPKKLLGYLPKNWRIFEFDELPVELFYFWN